MKKIIIGEMIKSLREKYKFNQEELGRKINVSGKTISSWEISRTEPNMGYVQQLADIFNVSTDFLIYGSDESLTPINNIVFDDYFPLHYSTNLSAGTLEELLDSDPDAVVYVPIKYQLMKKRLHAFKVNGSSMNNVIEDGSIVIAEDVSNILTSLKDGTIVVAFIDGQATVKRLYVNGSSITLMPDSKDKSHQPIIINLDDTGVAIIGRVIWHMNPDDMEKYY